MSCFTGGGGNCGKSRPVSRLRRFRNEPLPGSDNERQNSSRTGAATCCCSLPWSGPSCCCCCCCSRPPSKTARVGGQLPVCEAKPKHWRRYANAKRSGQIASLPWQPRSAGIRRTIHWRHVRLADFFFFFNIFLLLFFLLSFSRQTARQCSLSASELEPLQILSFSHSTQGTFALTCCTFFFHYCHYFLVPFVILSLHCGSGCSYLSSILFFSSSSHFVLFKCA